MALGNSVGDAYITVHADTKKFQADVSKLSNVTKGFVKELRGLRKVTKEVAEVTNRAATSNKTLRDSLRGTSRESKVTRRSMFELNRLMLEFEKRPRILARRLDGVVAPFTRMRRSAALMEARLLRMSDGFGRLTSRGSLLRRTLSRLNSPFEKLGRSIATSFTRMDRTVLLVLKLIAVAAPQIAALGSALSSTLVAIASSAFYALAGLTPMLGVLAPVVGGIAALAVGLQDLEKYAPGARRALDSLTDNFKDVAVPAFFQEWGDSAANFFSVLDKFLNNPEVFSSLGEAFAGITDGISRALSSDAGDALSKALTGPLSDALEVLGTSLGPLLETLFTFMAETAPVAQVLADRFLAWAENLNAALNGSIENGNFSEFMSNMLDSTAFLFDLLGSIKDVLGTLFNAGVGPGNRLLIILTDLLDEFDAWMNTLEGEKALEEWFSNGAIIMEALFKLLGAVGTAIADLITPDVIDQLVGLLDSLGIFADLLSDILAVVAEADIIGLIVLILNSLGEVIRPLLPLISDLIEIFVSLITNALEVLTPILVSIAEAFAVGLGPSIEVILGHLPALMEAFEPLLPILADILEELLLVAESMGEEFAVALNNIIIMLITRGIPAMLDLFEAIVPLIPIMMKLVVWLIENTDSIEGFVILATQMIETLVIGIVWVTKFINWLKSFWEWGVKVNTSVKNIVASVWKLIDALNQVSLGKLAEISSSVIGGASKVGDFFGFASGGVVTKPTPGVFGEDGDEALVPLDRPLSQVDPSVRALSAFAQGMGGGSGTTIEAGAIQVVSRASNERIVAQEVLDALTRRL